MKQIEITKAQLANKIASARQQFLEGSWSEDKYDGFLFGLDSIFGEDFVSEALESLLEK